MGQTLESIYECFQQASFGSLKNIKYVEVEGIESFPEDFEIRDDMNINEAISLKFGYSWKRIGVYTQTLKLRQQQKNTDQGTNYPFAFTGEFPARDGSSTEDLAKTYRRRLLDRMANRRFVFMVEDFEGHNMIVGSKENPVVFEATETINEKISDGHLFAFSLTGVELYRFFEYSAPVPDGD